MFKIPLLMLVTQILLLFALTFLYSSNLNKKLLCTFFIYVLFMGIEAIVISVTTYTKIKVFEKNEYSLIIGLILSQILSLLIVQFISSKKNIKLDSNLPNFCYGILILFSFSSIYIFLQCVAYAIFTQLQIGVLSIVILASNVFIVILYDYLSYAFSEKMRYLKIEEQKLSYEKQLELIQVSLEKTQILAHDINNHLLTIKLLCKHCEYAEHSVDKYLSSFTRHTVNHALLIYSKNYVIDSILNFKLQDVVSQNIPLELDCQLPEHLEVEDYLISTILCNLLDNAIFAVRQCKENPFLSIHMRYSKCMLIINIKNSFDGLVEFAEGKFLTRKKDKANHSIGLKSVEEVLLECDGYLELKHKDNIFETLVIVPVEI